jgi:predicted dienelactone hydrolase
LAALAATALAPAAHATPMGFTTLAPRGEDEPVTVYYPTRGPVGPVRHGFTLLQAADNGPPERGNGRLVVVSHGTGGGNFVHTALAQALVDRGFTVAMPLHRHDNWRDHRPGTMDSLVRRPAEVSRAIDAVGADPRLAPLLALDRVGVYGFSAGGFTALVMAGGRWSAQRFVQHCDAHLAEDWHFCTGVITRLDGGWLDGPKQWVARHEIRRRFDGEVQVHAHADPRVAAVVAAAPAAALFDMTSFARPGVPLGLVTLGRDRWLVPRFHSDAVLAACGARCERVAQLPTAGHGAMLSPLPPGLGGVLGEMLNDPPGFDRDGLLPEADRRIADYFVRQLRPVATPSLPASAETVAQSR